MKRCSIARLIVFDATFVLLALVSVAGQDRSTAAAIGTASRTRTGRPDLQGVWNYSTITPLERPKEFEAKEMLTPEEAARLEEQAATRNREQSTSDSGSYNRFWTDGGTKVVGTRRTSLIVDPPDGRLPPLTTKALQTAIDREEAATRNAGPEDRNVVERCIMGFNAGPPMLPGPYNNIMQFVQTADYVVILNEMVHHARIVPLDGRPHGAIPQWLGDSRAHWEGDTLVVETRKFTRYGLGLVALRYHGDENAHVTERFTRLDADTLRYQFTVTDLTIWTEPFTGIVDMTKTLEKVYEYACHEGNYAMTHILTGARAQENAGRP
jgi:hypothetical protein